jgi:hypothetical protein
MKLVMKLNTGFHCDHNRSIPTCILHSQIIVCCDMVYAVGLDVY